MFARTERLLLRPGWREDGAALHRARSDEAVLRGLGRAGGSLTAADVAGQLATVFDPMRPAARTFGAPRLVGGVALEDADGFGAPALSLWIARPYWRLGFATEAARAMIDFARDGLRLPRVVARVPDGRPAAVRLLAKLGFRRTTSGFALDLASDGEMLAA